MRKSIIFIALFFLVIVSLPAQSIADVFKKIPKDILYGISDANKAILVSNPQDSVNTIVPASIYAEVERLALSDNFLSLKTSDVSTTQIKLLSLVNNSKIICVVKTTCGKMCDSEIRFYTTDWSPIEKNGLFPRFDQNWFIKKDINTEEEAYKNAIAALDMNPCKIELSSSDDDAKIFYEVESYLSKEDYEALKPYLSDEPKVLTWNKTSFQ